MRVDKLLVRYRDGYQWVGSGTLGGFVNYPEDTGAEAERKAERVIDELSVARWSHHVRIEPTGSGDVPFADWDVGDTVTVPDHTGAAATLRAVGLTLTEDENGSPVYEPQIGDR